MVDGQTVFLTWDIFRKQEEILAQAGEEDYESDIEMNSGTVAQNSMVAPEKFGRYEVNSVEDD